MSDWPTMVGRPVDGEARCTLATTTGSSIIAARPMFSIIRLKPGPDVAVKLRAPAAEAPTMAAMLPSSSSICTKRPPRGGSRTAMCSAISVDGVIG